MVTKVQKWGNSLGVRIPKAVAQDARIEDGAVVELTVDKGRLVIRPMQSDVYHLNDLLAQITPDNIHGEVDVGEPVGREIW